MEPAIVVGYDHGGLSRLEEYGEGGQVAFMRHQVEEVQPAAAAHWRLDPERFHVAGSSLGGLLSFALALAHPGTYVGAASLSGSFFLAIDARVVDVMLYMDHGGDADSGMDGFEANIALRDRMGDGGWRVDQWPECPGGPRSLCHHHEEGARHDELAWAARAHQFLTLFLAPSP